MKLYLTQYDLSGIQNFIFNSPNNKVKENIGASELADNILAEGIDKLSEELSLQKTTQIADLNPLAAQNQILEIYCGGGNALLLFNQKSVAHQLTKGLYQYMLVQAKGLKLVTATLEVAPSNSLAEDMKKLRVYLTKAKNEYPGVQLLQGFSLNRQDDFSGEPCVLNFLPDEIKTSGASKALIMPRANFLKREAERLGKQRFDKLLPREAQREYTFLRGFDEIGGAIGESYLGVVHIDGNNLGSLIDKLCNQEPDYQKGINYYREISKKIAAKYQRVFTEMIEKLIVWLNARGATELEKKYGIILKQSGGKTLLPLRPLICAGDDLTFVCHGKLALGLTEFFLKKLDSITFAKQEVPLSACAGVVLAKSNFPFSKAYRLSEEVCQNAKYQARTKKREDSLELAGSWLDFHLHFGGVTTSLQKLRKEWYSQMASSPPLLRRPWLVKEVPISERESYSWKEHFKGIYAEFQKEINGQPVWPRSKLKAFREAYLKGPTAVAEFLAFAESRYVVYEQKEKINDTVISKGYKKDIATAFDVLEVLDFYVDLDKKSGSPQEKGVNTCAN